MVAHQRVRHHGWTAHAQRVAVPGWLVLGPRPQVTFEGDCALRDAGVDQTPYGACSLPNRAAVSDHVKAAVCALENLKLPPAVDHRAKQLGGTLGVVHG